MRKKNILGLDLGTNSVGWALIQQNFEEKYGQILGMGSRIIPMSQDILGEFGKGNSISQTAERTGYRGIRRIRERYLLRRARLHRVLNVLGYLPAHFANDIDFENRLGQFKNEIESKIAYRPFFNDEKQKTEYEFVFKKSFEEMLADFAVYQPALVAKGKKVPFDWTIYYLRKKALTKEIEQEELAWILLNFNQKRGYYQLRGEEEEETPNKTVEFHSLKIVEVKADEPQKGKSDIWYSLILENGWVYRRSSKTPLYDWKDKVKDFIVTTDINDDGSIKTDKEGNEKRSFRAPGEDDWTLLKKKTEQEIKFSDKTVGTYIYDILLQNPNQKIKGKLVRTIERDFYKDELKKILKAQLKFHPKLQDEGLYNDCVRELYRNNDVHQLALSKRDFIHLFINDIIFYQRPLKSKKSAISNCTLEYRKYKDAEGNEHTDYLKVIPKSHPLYQEFRLWQWIYNLSIYKRDDDRNVSIDFLNKVEEYEKLFAFLNDRKEIEQKALLKYFKLSEKTHRWNFVEDKKYPCNETRTLIANRLAKVLNMKDDFLTHDTEKQLWHIIYSVTDKTDYEKALKSFATKHQIDVVSFVENFRKFPPFKSEYGSFSEKAIKKLLPLMRLGKYWNWGNIDATTKERIEKIITGEYDENIKERIRERTINLTEQNHFQGLQLWLASYIVYGRHSEGTNSSKWNGPNDLKKYLDEFKQHSLRNPIVEQVVTETLRVVHDIWKQFGNSSKDFFDEIHIELGREMKNTADDRKRFTETVTTNENNNLRIKALLAEMLHYEEVENVRPYSPGQQEILKIYEDSVLNSNIEVPEDILKISKTAQPSSTEILRYKLWLEQKYQSPYTGEMIPLNKLFTLDYEIEHIIPQTRYFDDSFSNKVICESVVNKRKDNQLGLEFIKNHHGEIIEMGFGKSVRVFDENRYEEFIKEHYAKNRAKKNKLLLDDIPEKMIERQMNDTRYISKYVSSVLSNIVRSETNDDGINSKNIIPGNGKITTRLKQDWGLNDVWNEMILPRFKRMNQISNSNAFTVYNEKHQRYLPTVPLELSKGFQKKRIDHRHHAMDALVIACATRSHINFLNNQHALDKKKNKKEKQETREDLKRVLCNKTKADNNGNYQWIFKKPWENFTMDTHNHLEKVIVSFKQNQRIINKTTNNYEKWIIKGGMKIKELVPQIKGDSWAIRKPMHQETVAGLIKLRKQKEISLNAALEITEEIVDKSLRKKIKELSLNGFDKKKIAKYFKDIDKRWEGKNIAKVSVYFWEIDEAGNGNNAASRVSLNNTFNLAKIQTIADTGIQKVLLNHLDKYKGRKDEKGNEIAAEILAFSPEGIEEMNKNIVTLNSGKFHQPILKVRTYEPKGNKFNVGQTGNKKNKFVIAAKGTNLFFAIYEDENGKRKYETIPLNEVIEHQKWRATLSKAEQVGIPMIPLKPEIGRFLFSLSPNDLVYVPSDEERENTEASDLNNLNKEQVRNIYKIVSFTGNRLYAIPHSVATSIVDKVEFTQLNKLEFSLDKKSIREVSLKLKIDRIGNITPAKSYYHLNPNEQAIAHIDINISKKVEE